MSSTDGISIHALFMGVSYNDRIDTIRKHIRHLELVKTNFNDTVKSAISVVEFIAGHQRPTYDLAMEHRLFQSSSAITFQWVTDKESLCRLSICNRHYAFIAKGPQMGLPDVEGNKGFIADQGKVVDAEDRITALLAALENV